jgi:hypothetical protein
MPAIKQEHKHLLGGIIIVALIIGGFFFYTKKRVQAPETVTVNEGGVSAEVEGSGEINQIPVDTSLSLPKKEEVPHPSLESKVTLPANFPKDAGAIIENNIKTITTQLKVNPDSFESWMNLAQQYKIIEQYKLARDVWEYLTKVYGSATPFVNLGNLYSLNLKDFPKAESNYKSAIQIDPREIGSYTGLHELYRYSYKTDTNLAEQALLDGLKALPNNVDLLVTLAGYYKDMKRFPEAKGRYIEARDEAQKLGNTPLVDALNKEIASL